MSNKSSTRIIGGIVLGVLSAFPFCEVTGFGSASLLILAFTVLFWLAVIHMFHYANELGSLKKSYDELKQENRRLRQQLKGNPKAEDEPEEICGTLWLRAERSKSADPNALEFSSLMDQLTTNEEEGKR